MKCTLCGHRFDQEAAGRACASCPMSGGCGLVKCPNCGFELAAEPEWFEQFKRRLAQLWSRVTRSKRS